MPREVIIKPKSVEEANTYVKEAVVVSPAKKLYDIDSIYKVRKITKPIMANNEPVVTKVSTAPKVLYDVDDALDKYNENVIFSWNDDIYDKEPKPLPEAAPTPEVKTTKELLQDAAPKAEEFVEVKPEHRETEYVVIQEQSPKRKSRDMFINGVVGIIFAVAALVGGKTIFDYVQEAESLKIIAAQLESDSSSDIPDSDKQYLGSFGSSEKAQPDVVPTLPGDGFVQIIRTKPYYLLAKRKDGKIELRTGGSVGWRTNNPAEFGFGDFAKKTGAIGQYSKYAIYPSLALGASAMEVYLFNTNLYGDLSINEAIKKFYSGDANKAESVAKAISVDLNISRYNTKMKDLSSTQKQRVINVILKEESGLKGVVRVFDSMEEFNDKGF